MYNLFRFELASLHVVLRLIAEAGISLRAALSLTIRQMTVGTSRFSRSSLVSEDSGALCALAYRDEVRIFMRNQDTDSIHTTADLEIITVNGYVLRMYPLRSGVALQQLYLVGCDAAGNFVGASYRVRRRQLGGNALLMQGTVAGCS